MNLLERDLAGYANNKWTKRAAVIYSTEEFRCHSINVNDFFCVGFVPYLLETCPAPNLPASCYNKFSVFHSTLKTKRPNERLLCKFVCDVER